MKTKILIVEDDPHILLGLQEVLQSDGFDVAVCSRGDQALEAFAKHQPGLLLLDVMLPGLSGYDICKQLRARKATTPILMLTAKGQELDKVVGLDLGADDYVTKPFGVRELLARIHALLRRATPPSASGTPGQAAFQIGNATIDPKTFQLKRGKKAEDLTARELKLLQVFYAHPGEVLSRDRLLNEVWGYNYYGTTRTLDQVIVQLRRKLGDNGDTEHAGPLSELGEAVVLFPPWLVFLVPFLLCLPGCPIVEHRLSEHQVLDGVPEVHAGDLRNGIFGQAFPYADELELQDLEPGVQGFR